MDIAEEHVVQVVPSQASSLLSREQLERPQSAINTTRALVRCYNKLLWFGAEIGPVSNILSYIYIVQCIIYDLYIQYEIRDS